MPGRLKATKYKDPTRELVIRRDGGMCLVCVYVKAVDVHEIIPRGRASKQEKQDPNSWLWDVRNRCCLCRDCHGRAHTERWRIRLLKIMKSRFGYDYSVDPWRMYLE